LLKRAQEVLISSKREENVMKRTAAVLSVLLSLVGLAAAQIVTYSETGRAGRTVTNTDLEAYKQKRLTADRDYKENYEKLGFPSPEELDRHFVDRERVQVERIRAEAELAAAYNESSESTSSGYQPYYGTSPYGGFGGYGGYGPYYGNEAYRYGRFGRYFPRRRGYGVFRYSPNRGAYATPGGVFGNPLNFGTQRFLRRKR
jgi:hypothetical protein